MHLTSILSLAICAAMIGKAQAQACDCQGAVATLYDATTDCDPAKRVKSCTWMIPNRCCADIRGYPPTYYYYHSASMHGIENLPDGPAGWSIGIRDQTCRRAVSLNRNGCLNQGGEKIVFGAGWDFCKDRPEVCARSLTSSRITNGVENLQEEEEGECQGFVTPDVVFIKEREGEAGRPFGESAIIKAFEDGDVVDWSSMTVKEGKLELFYELTGRYGDGLSRSQMQAMKILAEEDAKRGVLSSAMARFVAEDLSLAGQRKACRSSDEL